jgi:hypothetical protein
MYTSLKGSYAQLANLYYCTTFANAEVRRLPRSPSCKLQQHQRGVTSSCPVKHALLNLSLGLAPHPRRSRLMTTMHDTCPQPSRHRCAHLVHRKKSEAGSSAERVWISMKNASLLSHAGHLAAYSRGAAQRHTECLPQQKYCKLGCRLLITLDLHVMVARASCLKVCARSRLRHRQ